MNQYTAYYNSEIGPLEIIATDQDLKSVNFMESHQPGHFDPAAMPPVITACLDQLEEYFKGERQTFSLDLAPDGTEFQQRVWRAVAAIPYGQTVSYLDIARQVGNEKAIRAVGAANGQNNIVIIIPCHRVIGSNGKLTGYGGGLWRKAWLLDHERKFSGQQMALF